MGRGIQAKIVKVVVAFLILLILFLILMPSPYKPTPQSCNEAKDLTEYIKGKYSFPRDSMFDSKSEPISWKGGRDAFFIKEPHVISVCYISSPEGQDELIDLVEEYKRQNKIRAVTIKFFETEYERTRQVQNGQVVSSGVEGLLRVVDIK